MWQKYIYTIQIRLSLLHSYIHILCIIYLCNACNQCNMGQSRFFGPNRFIPISPHWQWQSGNVKTSVYRLPIRSHTPHYTLVSQVYFIRDYTVKCNECYRPLILKNWTYIFSNVHFAVLSLFVHVLLICTVNISINLKLIVSIWKIAEIFTSLYKSAFKYHD